MFTSILLPLDIGGSIAERQLAYGIDAAKRLEARLHLLTVVPDYGMSVVGSFFPANFERAALDKAQDELDPYRDRAGGEGIVAEAHVAHGRIYDQILRAADRLGCDLIVIGAHRPELSDYLLGPNAARVVRHAKQSVVVIRD